MNTPSIDDERWDADFIGGAEDHEQFPVGQRSMRMNPNHDEAGRFASSPGSASDHDVAKVVALAKAKAEAAAAAGKVGAALSPVTHSYNHLQKYKKANDRLGTAQSKADLDKAQAVHDKVKQLHKQGQVMNPTGGSRGPSTTANLPSAVQVTSNSPHVSDTELTNATNSALAKANQAISSGKTTGSTDPRYHSYQQVYKAKKEDDKASTPATKSALAKAQAIHDQVKELHKQGYPSQASQAQTPTAPATLDPRDQQPKTTDSRGNILNSVSSTENAREKIASKLGKLPTEISDQNIKNLFGLPDNGQMTIFASDSLVEGSISGPNIIHASMALKSDANGKPYLYAASLFVDNQHSQESGGSLNGLVRMASEGQKLGVDHIKTSASAAPGATGYYTWPKLGFDAPIPHEVMALNPPGNAKKISDLMATRQGSNWWRQNGRGDGYGISMKFNLKAGSKSWDKLGAMVRLLSRHSSASSASP